jgi:hypothetical protein
MGPIRKYMEADHQRLDGLRRAGAWWEFRGGLLRHMGLEEKILLPDARQRRDGQPLPQAAQMRIDHGWLAVLLVPAPTPETGTAIDRLLAVHNLLEEGDAGVYAVCEQLAGPEAEAVAERLRSAPETPQRRYQEGPLVRAQIERALEGVASRCPG